MTDAPSSGPRPGKSWWLPLALASLCLGPELVLQGADLGLWGSARWRPYAYAQGAFWAGLLHGWWPNYPAQPAVMFVTYVWLHAGVTHLAGNLLALLWLGPLVTARFGPAGCLAVWTAASLGGAAAFGLLTASPAPMVGASGALFGLAAAMIVSDARQATAGGTPRRTGAAMVVAQAAGLVLLNLVAWVAMRGHLAWETHLGGALAGALAAWALPGRRPERRTRAPRG